MSEEEKKAFNFFKGCNEKDLNGFEFFSEPTKKQIKYMETLLNLIEEQQKEIEKKDIRIKQLEKLIEQNICYVPTETGGYEELNIYMSDLIPKESIREKIKELECYIYKGENAPQDFLQYRVKAKIQGYKELLGE